MRGKAGCSPKQLVNDPPWVQSWKVLSRLGNEHRPGLQAQIPANRHMGPVSEQTAYGTGTFLTGFSSSHEDFKYTSAFASNFETQECVLLHQSACTRQTDVRLDCPTRIHVRNRIPASNLTEQMEEAAGRYWEDLETINSRADQGQDLWKKKFWIENWPTQHQVRKGKESKEGRKEGSHSLWKLNDVLQEPWNVTTFIKHTWLVGDRWVLLIIRLSLGPFLFPQF